MVANLFETNSTRRNKQRGIALLLCIFALLLLTGIALALMFMSDTETAINANYKDSQRAYHSAMAGLEEARVRLMPDAAGNVSPIAPIAMPAANTAGSVTYIVNTNGKDDIRPWNPDNPFFDTQLCHEGFATALSIPDTGANVPCLKQAPPGNYYTAPNSLLDPYTGTSRAMDYKWVRITWKTNASAGVPFYVSAPGGTPTPFLETTPICFDGTRQIPLPSGPPGPCESYTSLGLSTVYRLTSSATTPRGSVRMLQMEVANLPPIVTNAAVDSQDHVTLNGQLTVNGYDYCSCDCTTTKDGISCIDRKGQVCDREKWAIYAHNDVDPPNNSENLYSGKNPAYVSGQPWPYDIPSMIETYKQGAVTPPWSCTAGSAGANANCGTQSNAVLGVPPKFPPSPVDAPASDPAYGACSNGVGPGCPSPQVTYVPGNVQLTGAAGNGILIVDGDLDIHGGLNFYGLILVKGVVQFTGGGSGGTNATNIYGAVLAGQESRVNLDNTFGGSANIQFDLCSLKQKQNPKPPVMLNFHEMTY